MKLQMYRELAKGHISKDVAVEQIVAVVALSAFSIQMKVNCCGSLRAGYSAAQLNSLLCALKETATQVLRLAVAQ
jgi:hypothetical protein